MPAQSSSSSSSTQKQKQLFPANLMQVGIGIASGISSTILSKTLTAPLEFLQLRFQNMNEMIRNKTLEDRYKGIMDCVKSTVKQEGGYKALWKGNGAYVVMTSLNTIFSILLSQKVRKEVDAAIRNIGQSQNSILKYAGFLMSILANGWILFLTYPFDYARIRLTMDKQCALRQGKKQFTGITNVIKTTFEGDGIKGLYRGILLSYFGIVVYRGTYFGFYDIIKQYFDDVNLVIKFMLGYFTTIAAGTITYPIDTIRKRMMMRSLQAQKYRWSGSCLYYISENEGIRGYYGGYAIKLIRGFSGAGLLVVYDQIKIIQGRIIIEN